MLERFALIVMAVLVAVVLAIVIVGEVATMQAYASVVAQREHFKQQYEAEHARYQELLNRLGPRPTPSPYRPGSAGQIGAAPL